MTLSTINTTDTFETWRQKDNAAVALLNTHDTAIAAIQASLGAPSAVTYYVATTGNDANDGKTVGSPLLTLQAAIDKALKQNVDKGVTITISVANGTYSAASVIAGSASGSMVTGTTWQTPLIITGTSSAILTSANQAATLTVGARAMVKITGGITLSATGSSGNRHAVAVESGGVVEFGNVTWGTTVGDHLNAQRNAMVIFGSNYTVAGSAAHHIGAYFQSLVLSSGLTVTLTGTPGFTSFIEASDSSMVQYAGHTFVGSATGSRYSVVRNGYLRTGTQSLTYLPGTTAGAVSSGGNYESLYTLGNLDATAIGNYSANTGIFTILTALSDLIAQGNVTLQNTNLSGVKAASMNGGVSTSGTTGAVTVNWANGALVSQGALTGAPTYSFTAPTNPNTWLTIMGAAAATPYTITWPGTVIWYGVTFTTTTANKAWVVRFFYDGTNYHAFGTSQV